MPLVAAAWWFSGAALLWRLLWGLERAWEVRFLRYFRFRFLEEMIDKEEQHLLLLQLIAWIDGSIVLDCNGLIIGSRLFFTVVA
jgi:hypothetical protein